MPSAVRTLPQSRAAALKSARPQRASAALPRSRPALIAVTTPPTAPSIRLCAAALPSVVSAQSVPWRSAFASARAHRAAKRVAALCSELSRRPVSWLFSQALQAWKTALQYFPASFCLRPTHTLTG